MKVQGQLINSKTWSQLYDSVGLQTHSIIDPIRVPWLMRFHPVAVAQVTPFVCFIRGVYRPDYSQMHGDHCCQAPRVTSLWPCMNCEAVRTCQHTVPCACHCQSQRCRPRLRGRWQWMPSNSEGYYKSRLLQLAMLRHHRRPTSATAKVELLLPALHGRRKHIAPMRRMFEMYPLSLTPYTTHFRRSATGNMWYVRSLFESLCLWSMHFDTVLAINVMSEHNFLAWNWVNRARVVEDTGTIYQNKPEATKRT